jgi:MFS family permease
MENDPSVRQSVPAAPPPAGLWRGYAGLLRANPNFRRMWLAQLISETGDWLYSLAVYDLLYQLTHSGEAVAWAIIIQTLPWALMTPLAGPIVDRFHRRRLMIVADLCQGAVVLGLLLVRAASQVGLVYLLLGLEIVFASVFEPARSALLPDIVGANELLPANALATITWSVALTTGAALGGVVTSFFGRNVAVEANAASYFLSAALVWRIAAVETHLPVPAPERAAPSAPLREGLRYVGENPKILTLILAKTGTGLLGGSMVILVIYGERIFPIAGHGVLAMGLLYAVRGVGSGIGPILGHRITRGIERAMWTLITASFFICAGAFLGLSCATTLAFALLALWVASLGGSNIWVMSATLLQVHTASRFRGRVFALDFGAWMLAVSVSNYLIGVGLDHWGLSARELAAALGGVMLLPGFAWLWASRRWAGHRAMPAEA